MDMITLDYMSIQKQKAFEGLKIKGKNNPLLTRTDLIVHQKLVKGNNIYKFEFNRGSAADEIGDMRLGKGEHFFPTHAALGIRKYKEDSDNNAGAYVYHYVDLNIFPFADEAKALEALYKGKLTLKVNSTDILHEIHTTHLRFAPAAQYQTAAASLQAIERQQYGPSLEERGYHRLYNDALLDGDDAKNTFILEVGQEDLNAIEGDPALDTTNGIVLMIHGFKYMNSFSGEGTNVCLVR